jgi:hypothetical protein
MTEGKVSTDATFTVSVLEMIPPSTINYTAPPIPAESTVFFDQLRINTLTGIFLKSDVFIKRPNLVKSLAFLVGSRLYPLEFVDVDSWDNSIIGPHGFNWATYYTVRHDFPLMSIDVFPAVEGTFQMTTEIVLGEFDINDSADLPNGYYPALQYGLAHLLALRYGNDSKIGVLDQTAEKYLKRVKQINSKPRLLSTRGRPKGSWYNIRTDTTTGRS